MGFSRKLQYFLVHQCNYTNAEAKALIASGAIRINAKSVTENSEISARDEIYFEDTLLQTARKFRYFKFYKPRGKESSLSAAISDSIRPYFENPDDLAIAGRLDKESEGLLLVSDDGKWVENICNPTFEKEKEYIVELDREPSLKFIAQFSEGVLIGGTYTTKACICKALGENQIQVQLKEGKNRQIRRMCHKLGYGVLQLRRTRVDSHELGDLLPGQLAEFEVL